MNQEWSLDVLYKGYDDPEFIRDMELIPDKIEEYASVVAALGEGDVKEQLVSLLKAEEEFETFFVNFTPCCPGALSVKI